MSVLPRGSALSASWSQAKSSKPRSKVSQDKVPGASKQKTKIMINQIVKEDTKWVRKDNVKPNEKAPKGVKYYTVQKKPTIKSRIKSFLKNREFDPQKGLVGRFDEAVHHVHLSFDDKSRKGARAGVNIKIHGRNAADAKAKAIHHLSNWPHGISDYQNLKAVRATPVKKIKESLQQKASASDIPYETIVEVFKRGLNDYIAEDQKINKIEYAFNRVNSFIAGGKAAELDEDLVTEISNGKLGEYIRRASSNPQSKNDWHKQAITTSDPKVFKKSMNRLLGVDRAVRRLSNNKPWKKET